MPVTWQCQIPSNLPPGGLFGPSSTSTVQNSLDKVDAGMPLTQDYPLPLINSTTGHYNSTGMHTVEPLLTDTPEKRTPMI